MKKIYFLSVAIVATLCAQPSAAQVKLSGPDTVTFYDGKNYYHAGQTIDRNPDYLSVSCPGGYIFNYVIVNGSYVYNYDTASTAKDNYAWESYRFSEPVSSMDVSIKRLSDVQTASYTLKSDKDLWDLSLNKSFSNLDNYSTVKAGTASHKFVPDRDSLKINIGRYLNFYQITHNGELVTLVREKWNRDVIVPLEDGDEFEVVTEIPDKMCHVEIISPNGEKGFITKLTYRTVNEEGREVYTNVENPESFDIPAGALVTDLYWNFDEYREPIDDGFNCYRGVLNGKEVEFGFSSHYMFPIDRDNIVLSMLAVKHGPVDIKVNIDDASRVKIKSGDEFFDLHDGLQTITVTEGHGLHFYPTAHSVLESIKVGDEEQMSTNRNLVNPDFYEILNNKTWNNLIGGVIDDAIEIRTADRERTIPVKVFVEDCNGAAQLYADYYIDSPYYFGLAEGENTFKMHADDLYRLKVSFTDGNTDAVVYAYPRSASVSEGLYTIQGYGNDIPEYEIIRIYGNGFPTFHDVTVTSEFDDADYSLRRDYHDALSGKSHRLPHGTLFHIDMAGENNAEVYVNGSKLASESPLSHSFVVTEPAALEIKKATTGIENVDIDRNEAPVYYNLQGVRVDNPANGIFIEVRNGKATRRYIK